MTCYAFIVGVNQEWPEQRCSLGDIGLARCLSERCRLPPENLTQVYDNRATRSNILRALEGLLDRRNNNNNARSAKPGKGGRRRSGRERYAVVLLRRSRQARCFLHATARRDRGWQTARGAVDQTYRDNRPAREKVPGQYRVVHCRLLPFGGVRTGGGAKVSPGEGISQCQL